MRRQTNMDTNDIIRKLHNINWNFDFNINYSSDSLYPFDCRKHYSYPATFIPEIPYTLIEILSCKGDTVLDPFGGIGTTFIQALLLERNPISCDINPIATNVCSALYKLFDPDLDREALKQQLLSFCDNYNENIDYTINTTEQQKELDGWYKKDTFNKICYLISKYNEVQDVRLSNVLKLVVSSMLSTLSSQNKGWAYIADNVKPKDDEYRSKPVFETYKTRIKLLFSEIEVHLKNKAETFKEFYNKTAENERIFNTSVVDVNLSQVDLIVTSPPYPKMIDYVKSQRMALSFLNQKYSDYTTLEIGARCRRANKNALDEYKASMDIINKHLCDLLKPGGFFCLVLPDYPENDKRKPIIDSMVKSYEDYGMKLIDEFKRYIPSNRRTISIQWASLVNEKILIFRKES